MNKTSQIRYDATQGQYASLLENLDRVLKATTKEEREEHKKNLLWNAARLRDLALNTGRVY